MKSAHAEVTEAFEQYIDTVEPRPEVPKRKPNSRRRTPARKA